MATGFLVDFPLLSSTIRNRPPLIFGPILTSRYGWKGARIPEKEKSSAS